MLATVNYSSLRSFALPAATRILTTLALSWLYILNAGAPLRWRSGQGSSLRSCSPRGSSDARSRPCDSQSYNGPKVRFSATVGEEPKVEVALV